MSLFPTGALIRPIWPQRIGIFDFGDLGFQKISFGLLQVVFNILDSLAVDARLTHVQFTNFLFDRALALGLVLHVFRI